MDEIRNTQDRRAAEAAKAKTGLKTMSVPEAGAVYFGLSRNASYQAAARGEIPTIRIGGTLRVPIVLLDRMLEQAGTAA
jgi:excisionase family DNA binding protein